MKILIIEDEIPAATRIRRLVQANLPEARIGDVIESIEDAVHELGKGEPVDLIFMDIHLADGLSFNIFDQIKVTAPVIFTTAFDQYAIQAFKVNSIDYLLKPVDEGELQRAIEKFRTISSNTPIDLSSIAEAIREQSQNQFKHRFLVKEGTRLRYVKVSDVAYFFSEASVSFINTHSNHRFLIEPTLDELEQSLDPSAFFRINRKMVLSLDALKQFEPYAGNRLILQTNPSFDEEIIVSRQKVSEFKQWIDS